MPTFPQPSKTRQFHLIFDDSKIDKQRFEAKKRDLFADKCSEFYVLLKLLSFVVQLGIRSC